MSQLPANYRKAVYWNPLTEEGAGLSRTIICNLCPHHCKIADGKHGICRIKENRGGTLYASGYGLTTSLAMDQIEKKPLYHFYPGSEILSIGVNGCNLGCTFCQNFQISQQSAATQYISPEQLAEVAAKNHSIGVAFTYTEPLIWFEYIRDAAVFLHQQGLKVVLVSNGFIEPEPFQELLPIIDAMNIDIKSMDEKFYKKICKATLAPVLANVKAAHAAGCHIEITNLVIPSKNSSDEDFTKLRDFIAEIDEQIPLHLSAYRPMYEMDEAATPAELLLRGYEITSKKLKNVYIGNLPLQALPVDGNTYCHSCGGLVIKRQYAGRVVNLHDGKCGNCNATLYIRST